MALNLMGGVIQRLESLRKYGFGTLLLFGDNEKRAIVGGYIIRGKELPPEMSESVDFDVFDFRKVNLDDASDKKYFEDILCWEGDFNGNPLKFNQGKVFK